MSKIILIGFMGSGKTTIGKALSQKCQYSLIDTDKYIEEQQSRTISNIFEQDGEEYFRVLETNALKELLKSDEDMIISTGGGLAIKKENRELLKEAGTTFYLNATPETIYNRVKGDNKRPLLQCEDPKKKIISLMGERELYYIDASNKIIDTDDKTIDEIACEILEFMNNKDNN